MPSQCNRLKVNLEQLLTESLALNSSNLQLQLSWLSAAIRTSKSTSTPWRATVNLSHVAHLVERLGVTEWDVNNAVVGEGAHGSNSGGLLTTSHGAGGNEDSGVLAPETASSPEAAGLVPESLPLTWEVAVAGWDANEEGVVGGEDGWGDGWDGCVLWWCVHLGQDLLWESLWNSAKESAHEEKGCHEVSLLVEIGLNAGLLETLLLSKGELVNVPVHRVLPSVRPVSSW